MTQPTRLSLLGTIACLSAVAFLSTAGCDKGGAGGDNSALISQGRTVYNANGCANCHSINGQGGRKAPDLSKVGAGEEHTAEWLAAHVKNPKAHNPGSRMPGFEGKISDKDLLALGAYLASLK